MSETNSALARRYATINDAASYIQVSSRTIRDWIRSERLTGYRFGPNTIRVDLTELDALASAV
jgi:excisionase family DNA binding protein